MKKWTGLVAAALLAALALPATAAAHQIIVPYTFCAAPGAQTEPAVSLWWMTDNEAGSAPNVTWTDDRNGGPDILGVTLWKAPPLESTVCAAAGDQSQSAVYAGLYAWADARSGESDVYGTDLWYGHGEIAVCTSAGRQESPSVSYRWRPGETGAYDVLVVWQDDRNGNWDIYGALIDPATYAVTEFPVCTAAGDQLHPTTDGENVVWEDRRGGDWDVYRYDLTERKEYLLSAGPADQRFPFISGERVVWQDDRRGDWDVWVYDVVDFGWRPTRTPLPLVVKPGDQTLPKTGFDTYVWQDDRNLARGSGSDIYGMVVDAFGGPDVVMREVPVCVAPGDQMAPAMSGPYVAWQDTRNDDSDIYGAQITDWNCDVVIDGGAAWTRSATVSVVAKGRWSGERAGYVSLSNDEDLWSLWLPAGQPLEWTLAGGDDGVRSVAAQFYDGEISPTVYGTITLDRHGPTTTAAPVAARRGAVVRLPYGVTDDLSPQARVRIRVRDGGAVAARIGCGLVKTGAARTVAWRCDLPRGRYTWEVLATDLAGNAQQVTGRATLTVR